MGKIGFKWNYDSHLSLTIAWNERLSEITSFKQLWCHCDTPQKRSKNPKLGDWARNKRSQYRMLKSGKKSLISDEKTAQLERLGFK